MYQSLSARRAWIEIILYWEVITMLLRVALRKESVDRNNDTSRKKRNQPGSLSARRAWIEISTYVTRLPRCQGRSPQGERG